MNIGFLFHRAPVENPSGIDQVRLQALSRGLVRLGATVTIVAPVTAPSLLGGAVPVLPLSCLRDNPGFDLLKACYHFSLEHVGDYSGPLVCRLVRVVDGRLPERDGRRRGELLAWQELAAQRACGMIFNNRENAERWRVMYGAAQRIAIIPTGCPPEIPMPGPSPYDTALPVLLFLGSLASPRMVHLINGAAELLRGKMEIHLIGRNKSSLYGGEHLLLSPLIWDHGEMPEDAAWDYIRHAAAGLALAAGPDAFDNDLSKIMSYSRGGVPILCEERVPNVREPLKCGLASTFGFGDAGDLAGKALVMASRTNRGMDPDALRTFCRRNSWDRRSWVLYRFLKKLISGG